VIKAKRSQALQAGHLVVVQLHEVFFAPVFVVNAKRPEDTAKKDVWGLARSGASCLPCFSVFVICSINILWSINLCDHQSVAWRKAMENRH